MPLYEYQCENCDHRFELIRKFSDAPVDTCPKCGGPVRKLISSPAIQFKGSGFYITDYPKQDLSSAKSEDSASVDAAAKTDKTEKSEKTGKSEKSEKSEKTEKAEKKEKTEKKAEKSETTASSKAPADPKT